MTGSFRILQRDGCMQQQWSEPRGLSGNDKETSQAGPLGPVATWVGRLHNDSSCLKLSVHWFGFEVPSTEG